MYVSNRAVQVEKYLVVNTLFIFSQVCEVDRVCSVVFIKVVFEGNESNVLVISMLWTQEGKQIEE